MRGGNALDPSSGGDHKADRDGRFELTTPARPPFEVEIFATGNVDQTATVTAANAAALEIALQPSSGFRSALRWHDGTDV